MTCNTQGDQTYVPRGIHRQVAQSTSFQNIHVTMPQGGGTTAVRVSYGEWLGYISASLARKLHVITRRKETDRIVGGFMSDLTFFGGNIHRDEGRQSTVHSTRYITFTSCAIAVSMIWFVSLQNHQSRDSPILTFSIKELGLDLEEYPGFFCVHCIPVDKFWRHRQPGDWETDSTGLPFH